MRKRILCLFFCFSVVLAAGMSAYAQTIVLNPITVIVENSERAYTRGKGQSDIKNIVVADTTIASAKEGGTNDVLITGKRPGRTIVTFYDRTHGRSYKVSVTVQARPAGPNQNPPGNQGGNQDGSSNSPPGYIRPIEVQSKAPVEPPTLLNTGNGYNAVYKNEYGEIVQVKEYDKNGKLIRTKEIDMYYLDGKPASVSYEKPNGDLEEITYDPSSNVITKEVYTELNKDTGYMKKEVLENGAMKKYSKDANGKWQPVASGNQPPPNPNAVQPPKNNANTPSNNIPARGFDPCLVGTWTSTIVRNDFIRWDNGGEGVVLTIGGGGQAAIDYTNARPNVVGDNTRIWGGKASGRLTSSNQTLTVKAETFGATITYINPGNAGTPYILRNGLGNLLQEMNAANEQSVHRYTCDATTLVITGAPWSSTFKRVGTVP